MWTKRLIKARGIYCIWPSTVKCCGNYPMRLSWTTEKSNWVITIGIHIMGMRIKLKSSNTWWFWFVYVARSKKAKSCICGKWNVWILYVKVPKAMWCIRWALYCNLNIDLDHEAIYSPLILQHCVSMWVISSIIANICFRDMIE